MKESLYHRSRGGSSWEMIGREIAALGMEIVVSYGKEGKALQVTLAAPKTDNPAL